MARSASAPGKIILCGEYAVVFGYPGIAIPSSLRVNVSYAEDKTTQDIHVHWKTPHDALWDTYIQDIITQCAPKYGGVLTMENSLPLGSGMGSSTALNIAVCRVLIGEECELKARTIEDLLSPGNSGIDFAVIWNEKAILFSQDDGAEELELPSHLLQGAFLIDTGAPTETTTELIGILKLKKEHDDKIDAALQTIGQCAERVLNGEHIVSIFSDHHTAQIALGVVPEKVQVLIAQIEAEGGAAKVIGAGGKTGGGGIVLAVGADPKMLSNYRMLPL